MDVREKPALSNAEALGIARDHFGIHGEVHQLSGERDQNLLITSSRGERTVLKITNPNEKYDFLQAQVLSLQHLSSRLDFVQRVIPASSGEQIIRIAAGPGEGHFCWMVSYIPGEPLGLIDDPSNPLLIDLGRKVALIDLNLKDFDHPAIHRQFDWNVSSALSVLSRHSNEVSDPLLVEFVKSVQARFVTDVLPLLPELESGVIHNDANDYNVIVRRPERNGRASHKITGIIDFGDMVYSYRVSGLAVAIAYAMLHKANPLETANKIVQGYNEVIPLSEHEISVLFDMAIMRLAVSVCMANHQAASRPRDEYLLISQQPILDLIPKLMKVERHHPWDEFRRVCGIDQTGNRQQISRTPNSSETLKTRRSVIGPSVNLSYDRPVKVVRGWMQYLYDDTGARYLDAYNNVPHVGHSHPRIVSRACEQMRILNTNTRYLSDLLNDYACRLLETFPDPLEVCYFVNSGSEANELALRLARSFTGNKDLIVLEAAYHGHTTTLIDISPYKHDGPGGSGAPDWVHTVPIADTFRGPWKSDDAEAGSKYANIVKQMIQQIDQEGHSQASFIAESCPSVGGQIVFPPGYLKSVYRHIRDAGGVVIADEVQTSYGRMGDHFYGFEQQGVVPDIVVLGKPIGNGHPIGAVITTRAIARSFDNGMEFFSTFGGNTVSSSVGLEVLNVVLENNLQEHARLVGEQMLDGFISFPTDFEIVGDVRGSGLFLGLELVRDPETLEPARKEANLLVNLMREQGILIGTDGPYHNVIKIRPPMPFNLDDADHLVESMYTILKDKFF
jgi:4-aminobutyrate aminotransferase-like enzyme/Ser/Thr protein kinase RdoA (MazF antagonist)